MMTETEAMASCLGRALQSNPNSFGVEQAKQATNVATSLLQAGKFDAETFGRVISRLGNHSALRQWAVQHGFLEQADDALTIAVRNEITRLDALADAELEKVNAKK